MDLENIKESTKDGIIQSFMENAKFARRGASHQRPKSWSKGTKSCSSKRKMREEGKREAKQMNEAYHDDPEHNKFVDAAHNAFFGIVSPADVTTHFHGHPDAPFRSVEAALPVIKE